MSDAPAARVAAIQMVSGPVVDANLAVAREWLESAAARGVALAALPEFFPVMGLAETDKVRLREADGDGPIQSFLANTARRLGLWIIAGSVPLVADAPDKVRNACLVFDAHGRRVARYDKIHLFGFDNGRESYLEARTIEPGAQVVAVETPVGRVGLSICYDLRFPELYRAMGPVDVIMVPSAFTATTGAAHWETLLRARAIENLAYVVAPAQGGTHPSGRRTWGHTMVVDPWGAVLDCVADGPGLAVAEIDRGRIADLRASLPALAHRMLGV